MRISQLHDIYEDASTIPFTYSEAYNFLCQQVIDHGPFVGGQRSITVGEMEINVRDVYLDPEVQKSLKKKGFDWREALERIA